MANPIWNTVVKPAGTTMSVFGSALRFPFLCCCLKTTRLISQQGWAPQRPALLLLLPALPLLLLMRWNLNCNAAVYAKTSNGPVRKRCGKGSGMSTGSYACPLFSHRNLSNTASGMGSENDDRSEYLMGVYTLRNTARL